MPHRILVVDDDRQIARLVRSYLEQAGFSVLTAFDGEAALALLRSERPDLVVLDLMLPGRNGWEITRIVREDKHLAGTPIIMLTARVEAADRIEGLEWVAAQGGRVGVESEVGRGSGFWVELAASRDRAP
ncbi:MAG: response regulator [Caldilineales bacterium]|nr:response regulator [Caldilineales bacterium]